MPECTHCNEHVSDRFLRVFGDKHGRVYACPDCAANVGIAETTKQRANPTRFSDDTPEQS